MTNTGWPHKAGWVAVALALATSTALAAEDYLAYVGPPSLRFATVKLSAETSLQQPAPPLDARLNVSATTNSSGVVPSALNATTGAATNAQPEAVASPALEYSAGSSPAQLPIPTGDWQTVQPEMLMDYFKPQRGKSKQGEFYFPVNIGFTPPVSQPSQQSRATYKVQ